MKPFSVFITSDDENNPHHEVQLQCYDFHLKKKNTHSPPVENILLLHCNGINCLAYKAFVEQLVVSCNCRVVTFDQRGHGMSTFTTQRKNAEEVLNEDDEDEKMWSWKTFARDAKMVLESVQREDGKRAGGWASSSAQKWHAVGHSLGGSRVTLVRSNESGDVCVDFNVRTDICVGEYEISGDAYVRRAGREFASQREEKEEDV